jgi:neutral amino acid transport system permease protein
MVDYLTFLITFAGLYSLFALGLNIQWGFTGLINFGHVAFMTLGAYATAQLSLIGVPIIIAVGVGMLLAALLGLLIGTSTLRLREDYLAIVTIGVSELLRLVVNNEKWLTDTGKWREGAFGIQRYPIPLNFQPNLPVKLLMIIIFTLLAIWASWQLFQSLSRQWRENKTIKHKSYQPRSRISIIVWGIISVTIIVGIYINGVISLSNYKPKAGLMLLVLLVLAFVYGALEFLVASPWGRILKAIREDEEIPKALGKNVFWYKLQAFMLGGVIAGLAGAFFAWQLTTIYPSNFMPILTFNAWIIVILGGSGSNAGALFGAIIFWAYDSLTRFLLPELGFLNESQSDAFRIMVIGLILIVLMMWRPQGILGRKEELTLGR